jgi:hypothetical protein
MNQRWDPERPCWVGPFDAVAWCAVLALVGYLWARAVYSHGSVW